MSCSSWWPTLFIVPLDLVFVPFKQFLSLTNEPTGSSYCIISIEWCLHITTKQGWGALHSFKSAEFSPRRRSMNDQRDARVVPLFRMLGQTANGYSNGHLRHGIGDVMMLLLDVSGSGTPLWRILPYSKDIWEPLWLFRLRCKLSSSLFVSSALEIIREHFKRIEAGALNVLRVALQIYYCILCHAQSILEYVIVIICFA